MFRLSSYSGICGVVNPVTVIKSSLHSRGGGYVNSTHSRLSSSYPPEERRAASLRYSPPGSYDSCFSAPVEEPTPLVQSAPPHLAATAVTRPRDNNLYHEVLAFLEAVLNTPPMAIPLDHPIDVDERLRIYLLFVGIARTSGWFVSDTSGTSMPMILSTATSSTGYHPYPRGCRPRGPLRRQCTESLVRTRRLAASSHSTVTKRSEQMMVLSISLFDERI